MVKILVAGSIDRVGLSITYIYTNPWSFIVYVGMGLEPPAKNAERSTNTGGRLPSLLESYQQNHFENRIE